MSDSESKEELAMVELRVTVAYQTKKLDELRARIRELEAEASRHRDALAKITRQCAEFESQISAHEKVCAGTWVRCSERLPDWYDQVAVIDTEGVVYLSALQTGAGERDPYWIDEDMMDEVTHWLETRGPHQ